MRVQDVYDYPGAGRVHVCEVETGTFSPDGLKNGMVLTVDAEKRRATERNHSATHLLQAGLRKVLGEHVRQMGSYVDPERLRFDFNHFSAMKPEEIKAVEEFVIRNIMEDHPVQVSEKTLEEARALGAMSLFDEKYGETVRVVKMGDVSLELCGGTHVSRTGRIGMFRIVLETSIAAGVRRIEAVTGWQAYKLAHAEHNLLQEVSQQFNIPPEEIVERLDSLSRKVRDQEKEIKRLRTKGIAGVGTDIKKKMKVFMDFEYLTEWVEAESTEELKEKADMYRDILGSAVVVLGAAIDGKGSIVATVTDDIIEKRSLKAGDIAKKLAEQFGGSGGGRPHFAMAGGKNIEKVRDSLTPKSFEATLNTLVVAEE